MTVKIEVERFLQEKIDADKNVVSDGTLKQNVTLKFTDEDYSSSYIETQWLTIDNNKSEDDYVKEAYELMKDNVTTWQNSEKLIGKTFNPTTGKIE